MRVLHVSHNRLPDVRIEKEAISLSKIGVETFFAGNYIKNLSFNSNPFRKIYSLPFNRKANLGLQPWWGRLKKAFLRILEDCRPDLVHAHNIIAAKLALDLDIPFIYDDHEYWSKSSQYRINVDPFHLYRWLTYTNWERRVLKEAVAVITVSDEIAKEHKRFNLQTIVLPNLPMMMEVIMLKRSQVKGARLSTVYIGTLSTPKFPYRNIQGFSELFVNEDLGDLIVIGDENLKSKPPIYSLGFLPHYLMMRKLTKYHIGILPWKSHPFHRYCNPNKAYEYANAGLLVMTTRSLIPVIKALKGFCETFNNYEELVMLLKYYMVNLDEVYEKGLKTMHYARKNLVWEKYENILFNLYEKCF